MQTFNRFLVRCFVDGTEVDYSHLLSLGLIRRASGGFVLTETGASLLKS